MMTDPIADMLTRIRNAVRVERPHVTMPLSKVKRGLAEVLKREGYIWDWEEVENKPANQLRVHLKYGPNGERVIRRIRRISKPGRRVYSGAAEVSDVLARHRVDLDRALDRVRVAAEWGVKLYYGPDALRRQVEAASKTIRDLRGTLASAAPVTRTSRHSSINSAPIAR